MKIVMTGGTGFIGQELLRKHCDKHQFIVLALEGDTSRFYQHHNVDYVSMLDALGSGDDAQSSSSLDQMLRDADGFICMGFARPVVGRRDKLSDYFPSIESCEKVFEACLRNDLYNVVFISTRSVYSKQLPIPHHEDEAIQPFSMYGTAKSCVEAMAAVYNESYGMHIKTLRLSQVLGAGEYQGVASVFLNKVRAGERISIWGSGLESAREYTYVEDVADACIAALSHPLEKGIFNIGSGETVTPLKMAELLCGLAGADPAAMIETLPDKRVEAISYCMSSERAKKRLGWAAEHSIAWSLEKMWSLTTKPVNG